MMLPPTTTVAGSAPTCAVSIVVANWNGRKLLPDCLASIYRLTRGVSFEVILSDDCSTDESVAFVRREFPRVTVHAAAANGGFARTNNAALPLVRGRYLWLLNNDTFLENDAASELAAVLDADPTVGICGGTLLNPDGSPQHPFGSFPGIRTELGRALFIGRGGIFRRWPNLGQIPAPQERLRDVDYIVGANLMIRMALARELGLFDEGYEAYFEDNDLCFRARRAGHRVRFVAAGRIVHLRGQSYGTEALGAESRMIGLIERGFVRFCHKNYSPRRARFVLALRAWAYRLHIALLGFLFRAEPARWRWRHESALRLNRLGLASFRAALSGTEQSYPTPR